MQGSRQLLEGRPQILKVPTHPQAFLRSGQAFGLYCFKDNPAWSCTLAQEQDQCLTPLPQERTEGGGNRTTSNLSPGLRIRPAWGKMVEI